MKLIIYTDGASRGNPGKASYGFVILNGQNEVIFEKGEYIGITTNNVAEYTAVLEALKYVKNQFIQKEVEISFLSDSNLVVSQLSGIFKVKSEHLKPLIRSINLLKPYFIKVNFKHIPRAQNSRADKLANLALDCL